MKLYFITAALVVASCSLVLAQPGSGGPTQTPTAEPIDTPLDGGASLLLASGVAYGLRRLKQRRQK